jgi:hypothetical protein
MATTHTVRWSVSATPVVTVDAVDGASMETTTVHENIRKSIGGSGEATTAGAVDFGGTFTDGTSSTPYLSATSGGVDIGDGDSTFIYVKNLGYEYDDPTTLGAVSTDTVNITTDAAVIAVLKAGEGWIIPLHGAASTGTNFKAKQSGGTDLAIEAIAMD